jgi:KipI family sensor histidine kinase inhibitor
VTGTGGDVPAVEIPVVYDGEDLAEVAAACGTSTDEVVRRHLAGRYECAFCGFAPGFAYLTGLDPGLQLPRRATPRTRVPAGAVAIAAEYTAVYPSPSPGGWHLLGRTDAVLWDVSRPEPASIRPGTTVRFVASL